MVQIIGDAISGKEVRSLPQSLWRAEQIRALEREWAEREGLALYTLMERAGAALRTYATHHWPHSRCWWIFTGPGNNGGDGYVLARLAKQLGLEPQVIALRDPAELTGDARRAADEWLAAGGRVWLAEQFDGAQQPAPDLVVVEGPLAGGHLGFDREKLTELEVDTPHAAETFHQAEYDEEVRGIIALVKKYAQKYGKSIPVVTAGGIYDHADVMHQMELGADGVQVATRFVTTEECDAPMAYKQAYLDAKEEDIVIVKSPVGMPGRAIKNAFLKELEKGRQAVTHCYQCLEHCDPAKIPYCITQALVNAARGDEDRALIFCGGNAWRAEKIETVEGVMRALCEG